MALADLEKGIKICTKCMKEKSFSSFWKSNRTEDGRVGVCKKCKKFYRKNKELYNNHKRVPKLINTLLGEKKCTVCDEYKLFSNFSSNVSNDDGLQFQCKECKAKINKKWKEENKEYVKRRRKNYYWNNIEKEKQYYEDNKEWILKQHKKYRNRPEIKKKIKERKKEYSKRPDVKKRRREYARKYRQENQEKLLKYHREYREENREKIRKQNRVRARKRREEDDEFRILQTLRSRQYIALNGGYKDKTTKEFLGCNYKELNKYITDQFTNKMSWDNYADVWEIDHKIPCNLFDLTDPKQQKVCFHYSNLQPLLKKDNRQKKNKLKLFSDLNIDKKSLSKVRYI